MCPQFYFEREKHLSHQMLWWLCVCCGVEWLLHINVWPTCVKRLLAQQRKACNQQGTTSAPAEIGCAACVDPLSVLRQKSFQLYVKCNPSHGVRRLRALILFHNPYAHTSPVPHHYCKVHSIDMLFMRHNWLIIWSFPPSTKWPDTPTSLFVSPHTRTHAFS